MSTKICFLITNLTELGGEQRVLSRMASEMAKKNAVTIVSTREIKSALRYSLDSKVRVLSMNELWLSRNFWSYLLELRKILFFSKKQNEWLGMKRFYSQKRIKALEDFINKESFDFIFALGPELPVLLSFVNREKLIKKEVKFIGWMHNSYEAYYKTPLQYAYDIATIAKKQLPKLDKIITLTKRDSSVSDYELGIKTEYIYNPLSFSSSKKTSLDQKRLLFVGRLLENPKGIDLLLEIARKIFQDESLKEWKLYIIGEGNGRKKLQATIIKYGLSEQVIFEGGQSNVIDYYLMSDILLLPSRWEGFGLVLTEAFECGVPVVAFENNGPSEIITDGKNGFLIEKFDVKKFAEKTIVLMKDFHLRKEFSDSAKMKASEFSLEKIIKQWEEIISQC